MKHSVWFLVVTAMLAMPTLSASADKLLANNHEVKYVIFMVPDGMGLADVTAARILRNCGNGPTTPIFSFCAEGPGGQPLSFETLEHIGYQRTYSKINTITDSSAAASTWACGEKFVNNEVCFHADLAPHNDSLLEIAKANGWGTGLVATQTITHATPAAFASHLANRNCETEIARQYVEETHPDVMLGGGQSTFNPSAADVCGVSGNFIAEAQGLGYPYVTTKQAMDDAVAQGVTRLLGLFAGKNLTPEFQRTAGSLQPRLPEMTAAALAILGKHPTGFFLMIEGSLIDSGNHAESLPYQYGEMFAFDQSVQVVRNWIDASPERQQHTLLIVAPDHETGGFAVKGVGIKGGELPGAGLGPFQAGWVFTLLPGDPNDFEAHHTGGDEPIWSEGPGSEALGHAIDNTDVYKVVKAVIE
ncbi:MAG: alkaline phosphatase [Acidobacteriia bacterium]|nr:alkaline phosphatase [Terriglobia bacterium]